jgi:hypothetical protein
VVSAGNSQRNSLAVSECQEELNDAIIPLSTTRRRAENRASEPHETPNIYSPSTVEGIVPPLMYAPRWRMELGLLHLSCPTIVYGTRARRVRDADAKQKDGYDQHNVATTTNSKEPMPKKTTTLCHNVPTRQNQPPTSRNTKHYSPSTLAGVAPLSHTPQDGERNSSHSISPARQRFTVSRLTRTCGSQDRDG